MSTNTFNDLHAKSNIKNRCRLSIIDIMTDKFQKTTPIKMVGLGGCNFEMERLVKKYYKDAVAVSYETDSKRYKEQRKSAPKYIKTKLSDIYNHKYSKEQLIWFDLTSLFRVDALSQLKYWLRYNQFTDNCVFAVTCSLHSRRAGDGAIQKFGSSELNDKYLEFINIQTQQLIDSIENSFVSVNRKSIIRIKYSNTDKNSKAKPMLQLVFDVTKN